MRSAVELAKDWRTDRMLRRLEAMLALADAESSLILTGNGDVLEPEGGLIAIGSGGPYAHSAARALLEETQLSAELVVRKSLEIAADVCIYTNQLHRHRNHREIGTLWMCRLRDAGAPSLARAILSFATTARSHPETWSIMMTPKEIVHELDKHIVGQERAKRAVAVALRNRWRRQQVAEPLRQEITPKNILMIGPTGVGKTEIARRLARLADAPFHQGRGDQIHRGRLRRPRRGFHRSRSDRNRDQADARCANAQGIGRRRRCRRGAHARRSARAAVSDSAPADGMPRNPKRGHAPEICANGCARASSTSKRDRNRRGGRRAADGDLRAARHAGTHAADPGHVPESGAGAARTRARLKIARGPEAPDRRRGRQADQRGGSARPIACQSSQAERHRLPRRDRQDRQSLGDAGRRRFAPGRAARPAAAGRGHHGQRPSTAWSRPTTSCSSPAAPSTSPSRRT